ncbi:MAG: hypothetical protein ACTIJJ_07035 [Galactobacter sp.]
MLDRLRDWLGRFQEDHPSISAGITASIVTASMFAVGLIEGGPLL